MGIAGAPAPGGLPGVPGNIEFELANAHSIDVLEGLDVGRVWTEDGFLSLRNLHFVSGAACHAGVSHPVDEFVADGAPPHGIHKITETRLHVSNGARDRLIPVSAGSSRRAQECPAR